MNEFLAWSFPLFRFRGIPIRCHWTLPLMAVFHLMQWLHGGMPWWLAPVLVGLLLLSVLLHEGGHSLAAHRVGGRCHGIMLWALGGFAQVDMPMRPGAHFLVAIMGPMVNLGIWALCMALLQTGDLASHIVAGPCLGYLAFVNLYLLLFNLIPGHPLDGGHATTSLLWGLFGMRRAVRYTVPIGFVAAAGVFVFAIMAQQPMLAFFAFWLGFEAYRGLTALRQGSDMVFGLDLAYARGQGGWFAGLRQRREAARLDRIVREEAAEAEILDRLLDKVSKEGLPSLSAAERRQLEQISKRQRQRDGVG